MTQYFAIKTAIGGRASAELENYEPDNEMVLTANASNPASAVTIQAPLAGGKNPVTQATAATQLWRFTPEGYIVNASQPSLVLNALGASWSNGVNLAARSKAQAGLQRWHLAPQDGATFDDMSAEIVCEAGSAPSGSWGLSLDGNAPFAAGTGVTMWATSPVIANMLWWIEPFAGPTDQPTHFRSALSTTDQQLLLTLPVEHSVTDDMLSWLPTTSQVCAGPHSGWGAALSTWQLSEYGLLTNTWNGNLCLTAGVTDSSRVPADGCAVYLYWNESGDQTQPYPYQTWLLAEPGVLVNGAAPALALTAAADGTVTLTEYKPGHAEPGQRWEAFGSTAMKTLLVQPPLLFPTLDESSLNAIEAQLWPTQSVNVGGHTFETGPPPGGLRAEYANLAAPLAAYQAQINGMLQSGDTTLNDVVNQLNAELTAVQSVQSLCNQLTSLYVEMNIAQQMALEEIATLVAATPKTALGHRIKVSDLIMGIVVTALNFAGGMAGTDLVKGALSLGEATAKTIEVGAPTVANVLSTVFDTMPSAPTPSSGQAELQSFADLQQALLGSFAQMGETMGAIFSAVLTDWRKVQLFAAMISRPSGPASLYWPSSQAAQLARGLLPGYIQNVLQVMMPTNQNLKIDVNDYDGSPSAGGLATKKGSGGGTSWSAYNFYMYLNAGWYLSYQLSNATDQLMDYVWASGAIPLNFYTGSGGWAQPVSFNTQGNKAYITVEVCNYTTTDATTTTNMTNGWGPLPAFSEILMRIASGTNISPQTLIMTIVAAADTSETIAEVNVSSTGTYSASNVASGYAVNFVLSKAVNPWVLWVNLQYPT